MKKEQLKRIFDFLKDKENKNKPFKWKLVNNEPLTEEELYFNPNLDLKNKNITSLPEGLHIGGFLVLRNTKITSLPKGLKVNEWLGLEDSKVSLLPKGLEVGGNLYIKGTPLSENYTNDEIREMIKPGFIKGLINRS